LENISTLKLLQNLCVLTVIRLESSDDRVYQIANGYPICTRAQGRHQVYGPLRLTCAQATIVVVGLPVFDVFVGHQVDTSVKKNASRAGPKAFEKRRWPASFIGLHQHVRQVRVFADSETCFDDL